MLAFDLSFWIMSIYFFPSMSGVNWVTIFLAGIQMIGKVINFSGSRDLRRGLNWEYGDINKN